MGNMGQTTVDAASGVPAMRVGVLVYDGDCGFCSSCAVWLRKRARGVDVVPWQGADLASLGLTPEECSSAAQFVDTAGRVSGGAAVAAALRASRQPYRFLGSLAGADRLLPVVERGYAFVAANRHRLPGGTPACASDGDEGWSGGVGRKGARAAVAPAHR
jgi:predicted DCC family thiol-disulfide oxidoreductase YuxK